MAVVTLVNFEDSVDDISIVITQTHCMVSFPVTLVGKGLTHHTDIPFASAHAQGPKQVSENLF